MVEAGGRLRGVGGGAVLLCPTGLSDQHGDGDPDNTGLDDHHVDGDVTAALDDADDADGARDSDGDGDDHGHGHVDGNRGDDDDTDGDGLHNAHRRYRHQNDLNTVNVVYFL